MKYYPEVFKIVSGALSGDRKMVIAYTELLCEKLNNDGENIALRGFQEKLSALNSSLLNSQSAFTRPVPVEKDNRFSLADRTFPSLDEQTIFLPKHEQEVINSFVTYIDKKEQLKAMGIPINSSLLLHGIPGTGKSKLAANLAARLGLPLITARADALISSYLGSTSKNIRSLLEYASSEPCVLFLDEFDAIAKARDDKNEVGELKRVVVSLLQGIDNLGETILIAATNHVHLLDPAIGRRFHYKMELKAPVSEVRYQLFCKLLQKFNFSDSEIEYFVTLSDGLTGAEIEMVTFDYLRQTVVNSGKVEAIELMRKILLSRYNWLSFQPEERFSSMERLFQIDNKLFSKKFISQLWNMSQSNVSKIFKENN
ncbi:AAA family ATPase [Shewanella xiamenensis]|uniref:AAA family ATPase n=1 Tax=Shewanella xiamenensis TaxID=332186 RepID=UPI00313B86E9